MELGVPRMPADARPARGRMEEPQPRFLQRCPRALLPGSPGRARATAVTSCTTGSSSSLAILGGTSRTILGLNLQGRVRGLNVSQPSRQHPWVSLLPQTCSEREEPETNRH